MKNKKARVRDKTQRTNAYVNWRAWGVDKIKRDLALLECPVAVAEDGNNLPTTRYSIYIKILRADHKVNVND